ncbi:MULTISPECIES: gallate dioxygenase [Rahnella]|jgi:gallate dioxygenase|uniref:Gallate dioxygenase n=1 Tax=Rahnella victoriana TaxID=1510570 RepID=A0ABS0DN67_9GAMM|nr:MULTISPECIES: gallate dioxygenase [Rahnella]VTQ54597.1 Protocatechuate 4,5-dioxygenase beta chain [Campylobacter jejuni]MBF7955321.1 gallate dioxygenase [Rahnella victoriana]PBI78722.1 protocatechuate 3,4-dioxygenase [Rahnella victoriana]TBX35325.1 gallate dioxygenase [Rahnella victoriana]TDS89424.1 protocatechuate 4,5-dioxygenase alpha subunit /protocatechuate 4,5-dioxygenase beta subunit [Rahnella sp. BIGb0236]
MAKIIGGLAVSHTPTIGFAVDHNKQEESAWAPIFESFAPMQKWLEEKKPDALVYIFNDHVTSFFFDHYSAFTLGIDEQYEVADEGGGPRDLPAVKGHAALSQHIGASLMADEFDMSFFQDKPLDHGLFSPLSALLPHEGGWPTQIVPLQIGVLQFPIPTARRCYKLGQALRRAIESFPEDLNVAIVATGGVSHQVHGERCGFNNPDWDEQFVDMIVNDPERLTEMTLAEFATSGGMEGAEVIMWLVMRGALSANVKKLHQAYYLPSMTGIATLILENQSREAPYDVQQRQRDKIAQQMAGVEKLPGTYPFTQARSLKALRINRFLHRLIQPAWRARFLTDQHALFAENKLTEEEQQLLRELDWRGMIHYGVSFFLLEKLGAVVGVSNLHIYSAMRGETLEEFQKTRNQQVLYSVAGKAKA